MLTRVLPNSSKAELASWIEQHLGDDVSTPEPSDLHQQLGNIVSTAHSPTGSQRTRAFIKVQDGCRNRCTFCIVTVARGNEQSCAIGQIVDEINALHSAGVQDISLTGVHLGGYGHDLGTNLYSLIDHVLRHTHVPRLRISSLEPWDLPENFFRLWENRRLCPHLHLPLQSGSDHTLRRMARRCDRQHYFDLVARAYEAIADLSLTTDIIVGFPGETERDFSDTLDACMHCRFAHVHAFIYSPRQGTAAARMDSKVSVAAARHRMQSLLHLANELKQRHLRQSIGKELTVLCEQAKDGTDSSDCWIGLTANYLRVEVHCQQPRQLKNAFCQVNIVDVDGDRLCGRVVASFSEQRYQAEHRFLGPTHHVDAYPRR